MRYTLGLARVWGWTARDSPVERRIAQAIREAHADESIIEADNLAHSIAQDLGIPGRAHEIGDLLVEAAIANLIAVELPHRRQAKAPAE
ncbi:hypothetical protein ACUN0C_19760 [Faunimonas sp. B44]|uniref:hypothetical protein n=1 Tax=Faunimonas sp. B44 TaxID=3461493 RepID=UPI004043D793